MIKACDFIDNQNFEYFFSGRTIKAKLKVILQGTIYGRLFRSKEINKTLNVPCHRIRLDL